MVYKLPHRAWQFSPSAGAAARLLSCRLLPHFYLHGFPTPNRLCAVSRIA